MVITIQGGITTVNLSINADLVKEAKRLGINISKVSEKELRREVRRRLSEPTASSIMEK